MKKQTLLILFATVLLVGENHAQKRQPIQSGKITYHKQSKITDVKLFNETSKTFIKYLTDNLRNQITQLKLEQGSDTSGIATTIAPFGDLMHEGIFKIINSDIYTEKFEKDRIISLIKENESDQRERFYFSYTDSTVYNGHSKEEITNYYDNEEIISFEEYKTEQKEIKGYKCFKIYYTYREKGDDEEFSFPEIISKREVWVTDQLSAPFHSIIRNKKILSKYYPLEIIETTGEVNGFETKYLLESISLQ